MYQEKVKIQKATWVYLLLATEQVILINVLNTFFFNLFSRSLNTVIIFQEDQTPQTAGTWQNRFIPKHSSTQVSLQAWAPALHSPQPANSHLCNSTKPVCPLCAEPTDSISRPG